MHRLVGIQPCPMPTFLEYGWSIAFFSIRPFVDGIKECGFHLVSRFRDTASLYYVYTGPRSHKPGHPKTLDGKIDYKKLDLTRMVELHIEGLEGTAYTLIAYSKALKQKVRLVIWVMPNGKHKLFFSTKTSMSGEEVLRTYRSRFQIEFCFRDAKQYTGLTHCQARHKNQLDFSYNASFLISSYLAHSGKTIMSAFMARILSIFSCVHLFILYESIFITFYIL